ncbi:hypothetical protein PQB81_gp088 [Arthrobacter phage Kardesai]|uniref:Uncharacterized protein n=1 Tax=Arthrobacter phage Kardesai TaxID=2859474 RepID=A0AAE7SMA0_9CAUD|nr:hypothetical protein PQB81_gp088 [Arthrobacter phage Kardesai]QXO12995.1 hypothetical protein SEA_KARDESAI_88 [Arthrobacter phage Kardesai]
MNDFLSDMIAEHNKWSNYEREEPPKPRESSVIHHGKVTDYLDVTVLPPNTVIYSDRLGWYMRDQDGNGFSEIYVSYDPDWRSDEYMTIHRDYDWKIVSVPTHWIPTYLEEYLRFAYKEE